MNTAQYNLIVDEIMNKNNLNSASHLGRLMELINCWKPKTKEEWESMYVNWAYNTGQHYKITAAVNKAYQVVLAKEMDITRDQILEVFKRRIVDDCWKGRQREIECAKQLRNEYNLVVTEVDDELDRKYGVDLLVYDQDHKLLVGVQVKGVGYFYNQINRERDIINPKKYRLFKETFGVSVIEIGMNDECQISYNKILLNNFKEVA